jgi:hypothetical protein
MFSTQSYRDLIEELSQSLPRWSLSESDVTLEAADLAIVMAEYGSPAHFVCEALEALRGGEFDTFHVLALRATLEPINDAVTGCGVAVLAAIMDYAVRQVVRDVELWRDSEPVHGPRESDETYYGVASVFAARNGAA